MFWQWQTFGHCVFWLLKGPKSPSGKIHSFINMFGANMPLCQKFQWMFGTNGWLPWKFCSHYPDSPLVKYMDQTKLQQLKQHPWYSENYLWACISISTSSTFTFKIAAANTSHPWNKQYIRVRFTLYSGSHKILETFRQLHKWRQWESAFGVEPKQTKPDLT